VNAGIVVWKISSKEDGQAGPENRLFAEAVPRLRNGQALAHVTGYAYDGDRNLAYVGLVGYKTSLESLKVTLMVGKALKMVQDGKGDLMLTPIDRYEQVWQAMSEYTSYHAGFVSRLALPGKWEPDDQSAYILVYRGTPEPQDELPGLFIERLKEALDIPILDEWADVIWKQASDRNYVHSLTTGGDCILGARIDLQADWQGLLTDLLQQEELTLAA
jgi:hypothetical protein